MLAADNDGRIYIMEISKHYKSGLFYFIGSNFISTIEDKNIKTSTSGKTKMIPDRNLDLYKGIKDDRYVINIKHFF